MVSPEMAMNGQAGIVAGARDLLGAMPGAASAQETAEEFAGLFYTTVIKEMQKSIPENPYFGSAGEKTFRSIWVDEMGSLLAKQENDPLAKAIFQSIEARGKRIPAGKADAIYKAGMAETSGSTNDQTGDIA